MKFCSRCGTQLENDCAYCSNCGAAQKTIVLSKELSKQKLECLGKSKNFFIASVAVSLIMLIWPFFDIWKITAFGETVRTEAFYEDSSIALWGWLLFLGSAACAALPLYTTKPYKASHYILGFIVKALALIATIGVNSSAKDQASRYYGMADAGLTFAGWLMILMLIAGIAADIKMMIDIKKYSKQVVSQ